MLTDRLAVINVGVLSDPLPTGTASVEEIGLLMGGAHGMGEPEPGTGGPCRLDRAAPGVSWQMLYATPPLAVALTILTGFFLFLFMGYNPFKALMSYFVSPLLTFYGLSELAVKAAPLITIAVGLAIGFRANV